MMHKQYMIKSTKYRKWNKTIQYIEPKKYKHKSAILLMV